MLYSKSIVREYITHASFKPVFSIRGLPKSKNCGHTTQTTLVLRFPTNTPFKEDGNRIRNQSRKKQPSNPGLKKAKVER